MSKYKKKKKTRYIKKLLDKARTLGEKTENEVISQKYLYHVKPTLYLYIKKRKKIRPHKIIKTLV